MPFGGDCSTVLSADVVADIFDGESPTISARNYLRGVMPDVSGSIAQLGGLACNWVSEASQIRYLGIAVVPVEAVPADVLAARTSFGCYGWSICGRGEVRSGMWVLAETPQFQQTDEAPSEAEMRLLKSAVDRSISSVFAQPQADFAGFPTTPTEDWWSLPPCETLQSAASEAAGMTALEPGFPGDNVPEGPTWEVLEPSGVVRWCPWYENVDRSSLITVLHLQSGVGAPSDEQLRVAHAEPTAIPGADAAYRFVEEYSGGGRSVQTLAVVGPNRLLVSGDQSEAVAAAVIAALAR
ncbi:hypothetical protein Q9R08_01925 [Microbacterium sp. QXD-8]|uniref:ESX secretion-associated protein EspG n=1 Tax=Microbacterium psychrotolerans TaxID=3068321 RepID=A0ABU0YYA2_9MICO|nr:hypothetical protein [Microbacterium sp. QXD-8]MDQ7876723.1 hypothetical protein [Microbacterium sp. QXD-8]